MLTFDKALDFARKAAKEDNEGNYKDAINFYKLASEHFLHYLKFEKASDLPKQQILEKIKEYMDRAETLTEALNNPKKQAVSTGNDNNDDYNKLKDGIKNTILQQRPNVLWDDIAGLELAKQSLQEAVILPTRFPQLFGENRRPWKGILLFGPPGTGKTQLAKAVATEANNAAFIHVTSSDLISKWLGESEKQVKAVFEIARECAPAVIFIDEIDSICSNRTDNESGATRRVKTEILNQMQGLKDNNGNVLVLGATNCPWIIDSAVRRRFEKRVYIPLPEFEARVRLFENSLRKIILNVPPKALNTFAEMTEGYSGSDIMSALNEANMEPVRRVQHATHFKHITGTDPNNPDVIRDDLVTPCSPGDFGAFEATFRDIDASKLVAPHVTLVDVKNAILHTKPSVAEDDITEHIKFMNEFGIGS